MPKHYVTFGQVHSHSINGVTFDKDCVAVFEAADAEEGRNLAFEFFGDKFCFDYTEDNFSHEEMLPFFPRGVIEIRTHL